MLEVARLLASVSVLLLIGALIVWMNLRGRAQFQRLNASAAANVGNPQIAAVLLLAAVGVSAAAAILAIAGWFAA